MKKILITLSAFLLWTTPVFALPYYSQESTLIPEVNNARDLGTSTSVTGTARWWRNIFLRGNLTNDQMADGCAKWLSSVLTTTGTPCGAGGSGGGAGTFGTTTSNVAGQLINYSLNNTDIVTIGGSATTSAKYWFDPNTSTSFLNGNVGIGSTSPSSLYSLGIRGDILGNLYVGSRFLATSSVASVFPYASTTAATIPTAFITKLGNLTTNGFVKTGSADGTLSVDTSTYLTGNQNITLSGDVTGSGTTAITTTIGNGRVTNAMLANSTISGIALGSTLNSLTPASTLTGTAYNGSSAISDWGINLNSANVWTASTTFQKQTNLAQASTSMLTVSGNTYLGSLNGILKGTNGLVGTASNGTDYSLISALSCGAGQHLATVAANGTFTCSADTGSGGGGSNTSPVSTSTNAAYGGVLNVYPNNATDIVEFGGTSGTTTAKYWFDPNGNAFRLLGNGTTTGVFNATVNITAPFFNATGTVASILPYASSTALTAINFFTTNALHTGSTTLQDFTGVNATTTNATTTSLGIKNAASALLLTDPNGSVGKYTGVTCTNQFLRALSALGASTCATVANTDLANSTISGVALGGTLNALTATNGTLTFSGSYDGTTARTVGLNLGNANVWTASTTFQLQTNMQQASSTIFTAANGLYGTYLGTPAGAFLATDPTGKIIATSSPAGTGTVTTLTAGTNITFSSGATCTTTCTINSSGGGGSGTPDWNKQTTFNTLSLTPTTTIAVWLKDKLFASSTAQIDGDVNIASSTLISLANVASTSISHLETGGLFFDQDAGIVNAFDLPVVNATNGTVQSYSFTLNSSTTPNLTIYGESNGSSGIVNQRVGIGSTTPTRGTLVIEGMAAATSTIVIGSPTKPTCIQTFSTQTGTAYKTFMSEVGALTTAAGYCQ